MIKKVFFISALAILTSCGVKMVREFFVLAYLPEPESLNRFNLSHLPIDARVEVQNFEMNRIYDRNQIVIRESLHKLSFDERSHWALRPNRALPELVMYHINSAGLFKECKTDFLLTRPDYYISGIINNIEIYSGESAVLAHLNVVLELRDRDRNIVVSHKINEKKDIKRHDITIFVKTVGELMRDGTHEFMIKIVNHFTSSK